MTVGTGNTGKGGDVEITAGQTSANSQTGAAVTGKAGKISMTVGTGNTGKGGDVEITAGQTSANSQTGGDVTATGGAATGSNSNGGSVYLYGGASSSGAGGSVIIKPGTGSSAGVTYIKDSGGTTQMQIDGNGITISSTLTAQGTVYALGGMYVGSHSAKALISNIIRGSYTLNAGGSAITPGSSADYTVSATGALNPSGSTFQQVLFSPNQDYETSVKPMFMGWVKAADTLTLRVFNVH